MNRYKHACKILLNRQNAGKNLTILDDDIFLVSYPKSGNTWLRFLIGNLIATDSYVDFSNVEHKVPDIYQNTDQDLLITPRPRLLKSHEPFVPEYKKIIYIVRDPRDILVSYYFHAKKFGIISSSESITKFVPLFLDGSIDKYGSWFEHVGSWVGAKDESENFFVIRYEDILADTLQCAAKISNYLNLNKSETSIRKAVEYSSSDHMKKLEKEVGNQWKATKNSDQSIPFVRNAKSGNWAEHLTDNDVVCVNDAYGKYMKYFGYL